MFPCVKDATQNKLAEFIKKFALKTNLSKNLVKSKKGKNRTILTVPKNNKFQRKVLLVLGKWSNWPKKLYKGTFLPLLDCHLGFLDIWCFSNFMSPEMRKKSYFWPKKDEN